MTSHPRSAARRQPFLAPFLGAFSLFGFAAAAAGQSAPAPAPADASTAPAPSEQDLKQAANDQVVQMEAVNISTTIGAYHEETSSMATKVPTSLKELPSSLQILNANAIGDRNATSLQDVYSYIIGVAQSQGNTNGFTFRGFPNTGTFTQNIEYDGLQGGVFNHSATSAADVEDLEFLKGPNSVLYGQMHPGGLLNVVSKVPQENQQIYLRFSGSTYAGRYNNFGDTVSGSAQIDSTGPIDHAHHWLYRFIIDVEDNQPFRPHDYDRQFQIYPSLTYRWNQDTFLIVQITAGQDLRRYDDGLVPIFTGPSIPVYSLNGVVTSSAAYGPNAKYALPHNNVVYQAPSDWSRDKGEAIATQFQKRWSDNWTLRFQSRSVWHTDAVRDLDNNNTSIFVPKATYATPATTFSLQYNHNGNGHRYNFFDTNIYGLVGPDRFQHTLIIGVGGGQEFYDNQRVAFGPNYLPAVNPYTANLGVVNYPADGTSPQSPRDTLDNLGEYISDQMRIGQRLHVTLGTRHDQQESHGIDPFNPVKSPYIRQFVESETSQAGVVADITKTVSGYASYSQSVVPNVVTSIDQTGHAGFPPEKGTQYEGGLKFETPDRKFFASVAAYWISRTNVLVATGLTLPVTAQAIFRLDGAQHSEGGEFETEYQPLPYWQIQGGFSLGKAFVAASAQNPQTIGKDLVNAPREGASLWNRFNVPSGPLKGFGVGGGLIYTGHSWGGDPSSTAYFPVTGWARVDAAVYYKWHRYSVALNCQNLLDRKYILAAQTATLILPGDERKITLSMGIRF